MNKMKKVILKGTRKNFFLTEDQLLHRENWEIKIKFECRLIVMEKNSNCGCE